ncbi:MAG TPA: ABC transporter permease [Candidatus Acidoferrum sp.]
MRRLRAWFARLGGLFGTARRERDLAAEIEQHLQMHTEDNMRSGMKPDEARRAAIMKLGGAEQTKEIYRERRSLPLLEALLQDVRYALRMLRKNPGFTAAIILTLALGIGANSAIFTLTYAVILKGLPVPRPGELVRYTFRDAGNGDVGLSGPQYDALRKSQTATNDLLAWSSSEFTVDENGNAAKVHGALMTANGFRVLELRPFEGQAFGDSDDVPGGGPRGYQCLIGYAYWKQHLAANEQLVGKTMAINGRSVTVAGILPPGFDGLVATQNTDLLLPLSFDEVVNAPHPSRHHAGSFWLTVMGRLKPGQTLKSAAANLKAIEHNVTEEADTEHIYLTGFFASFHLGIESGRTGRSFLKTTYSQPLIVLEVLAGLLLVLCCANIALLMLARVSSRSREFAVRNALGAPRHRIFQQVLAEIGLVTTVGLAAGIALGWIGARGLVSMLAAIGTPPPLELSFQTACLLFTAAISVLSALGAGLWPAWRASRVDPNNALKQGGAVSPPKRMGVWIVPAQVAVSVTLLACASLLSLTFVHLFFENSGLRPDGVTLAEVDLTPKTAAPALNASSAAEHSGRDAVQILEAIQSVPGQQQAAAFSSPPLYGWISFGHYFAIAKQGAVHTDMQVWPEVISTGYFPAMGTRILEGRGFERTDTGSENLCVLNASAAAYFFPGEDAIGKFVYSGGADPTKDGAGKIDAASTYRVVGIAEDSRFRSLREPAPRMIFTRLRDDNLSSNFFIAVRSDDPRQATSAIREAIHRVSPGVNDPKIFSFNSVIASHLRKERMLMALSGWFAGIALLLTTLGLYGVLSRSVVLRTREIGLRLALGARPSDALGQLIREGLRLVLLGAAIGLLVALTVTKLLGSLLFGIHANDPLTLFAVVAVLLVIALTASFIPARRAMRVDPMVALRYE